MRKLCVLCGVVVALAVAPRVAYAAEPAPSPAHALLPPSLLALEQKQEELKVTSLRFSAQTSLTVPHREHELLGILELFLPSRISGEETLSPKAENVTFTLFRHPLKLREVGKTTYIYIRALARHDHGRPWVKLGPGGFLELLTVNGKPLKPSKATSPKPTLAEPPFAGLRKALAGAEEVREVGTGTLYGQPVTNFFAVLEPEQLKREHLASTSRLRPRVPQPPTATLETSLAQDGLPVRTVVTVHTEGAVFSITSSIPAINFPLVITAPPASQTISIARLRVLARRARRHRHAKRRK